MKLKKEVEIVLTCITITQFIMLGSIYSFELKALPFILLNLFFMFVNIKVLEKYGQGLFIEKDGKDGE